VASSDWTTSESSTAARPYRRAGIWSRLTAQPGCQNLLEIGIQLALAKPTYIDMCVKFVEHFLWISSSMMRGGGNIGMWETLCTEDDHGSDSEFRGQVVSVMSIRETALESLFTQGGPGARIMRRFHLLHPELGVASTRAALILAVVTWVPLLIFSAIQGLLVNGAKIPFLEDIAAQTRFLLAVPLLVLADIPVGFRMREMVRHFLNSGLIRERDRGRFGEILVQAVEVRDSRTSEIVVVALAYIATYLNFSQGQLQQGSTWYTPGTPGHLSLAGYWYVLVALPIFQFLIFRWIYRMFNWARFLFRVSRLDLKLSAAHPDAAGGLAFLGKSLIPLGTVTFALSSVTSSAIASRVFVASAQLQSFATAFVALFLITLIIFVGPLLVFTPRLVRLKYQGMLKYGVLAGRYTQLFEDKWVELRDGERASESVLGNNDIQSLADLGNSFELVRKMRVFPVEPSDFIALALATLLPGLPLLTAVMPLSEILKNLLKLIA
jgi:hypothetical protein